MRKLLLICLLHLNLVVFAQYALNSLNYTQDFNSLGTTTLTVTGGQLGSVNIMLDGWCFAEGGTSGNDIISSSDGSASAGDTYNYGTISTLDRSLGSLLSGTVLPVVGFCFINNTGDTITSISLSFTGEQWRLGAIGRMDRLDMQYSFNATSLTNGIWVDADQFDLTAPLTAGTTGAKDGNAVANRILVTGSLAGVTILPGATVFLRWTDFNATGSDDGLSIDDFSLTVDTSASGTGYYRSAQSGSWDDLNSWQTSVDSVTWVIATSIPSSAANSIVIRGSDSISIRSFVIADQLQIESGGKLNHVNGLFTVNDGAGDDIRIHPGGMMILSLANNPPVITTATTTIQIFPTATLRIAAAGVTPAAPTSGVNTAHYIYHHESVLEWALGTGTSFSSSDVTYFPNVNPTIIPIFRTINPTPIAVGSTGVTAFNGVFEHNGATITWQNSGNKVFRNGVYGTGNMLANATAATAKFIVNGVSAVLGGTGTLTAPSTGGLEIGPGCLVKLIASKTVTGNIHLLADSYIETGNWDLRVSGRISGGGVNSYVRTNGTGALVLNSVSTDGKLFPVGYSTYNPVMISNGQSANYSVSVKDNFPINIFDPARAVLRTWTLGSSVTNTGVIADFHFAAAHTGTAFNLTGPVQAGININGWNIYQSGLVPTGSYVVSTTVNSFVGGNRNAIVLGNAGAILSVDFVIEPEIKRIGQTVRINWTVSNSQPVKGFEIQQSLDGIGFSRIAGLNAIAGSNAYSYSGSAPPAGPLFYRIVATMTDGKLNYSKILYFNETESKSLYSIFPNPASDQVLLNCNTLYACRVNFILTDIQGRLIRSWTNQITRGSSVIPFSLKNIQSGIYYFSIQEESGRVVMFVVVRK